LPSSIWGHRYHRRSAAVRMYVLARADGTCESCNSPAPFCREDGTAYLEPHHTRRLSDGGPDHPRWVGAVCPNCHREIHHGAEGKEKNTRLQQDLAVPEGRKQ
jgi:5-methylcytosine-specific restriction protein A